MRRRNEVLVGMMLVAATVVAVLGTLWLARGGLRSGYPLYTQFEWGQNLKQGQPVALAGVSVGFVNSVDLREGGYLDVQLSIDQDRKIPQGSKAIVQSVGLFGDVQVALLPPKPLSVGYYEPGDTVPAGTPAASVDQILARVDSIGRAVQHLTGSLEREMVDEGGLREMRLTVGSASELVGSLNRAVVEQNRNLTATLAGLQRAARAVDSGQIAATVANIRQTSENTATLTRELNATTTRLNALLGRLDNGDGTAGKLLTDTLLYRDLRNLVGRVDSLTADFKKNPRKYINLTIF